jgi:hypothetical protein
MIFVLERATSKVDSIPPNPESPEGAVGITFSDGINTFPIVIPKFQAWQLGNQILAASKVGEGNGAIVSPEYYQAEPVYAQDDDDEIDVSEWPTPAGPE